MGVAASHNTDLSGLSNILNNEMQRQIALTTLQFENEQAIKVLNFIPFFPIKDLF